MSTNLIVMLSVLGIGALIGIFYFSHVVEKQRRQKALLIANLNDYVFRIQRLIDYIPKSFLPKELHLVLLQQIKKRLERLTRLAPDADKFEKRLQSVCEQISELAHLPPPPPNQFKSKDEANELKVLLQDLSRTVEMLVRNKSISLEEGKRHLHSIHVNFSEANLKYLLHAGQVAAQDNKLRLAVLNYEKAISEMQKRNQNGQYSEQIAQLLATIKDLNNQSLLQPITESDSDESELTQGMENFIEQEDAWKKKYF